MRACPRRCVLGAKKKSGKRLYYTKGLNLRPGPIPLRIEDGMWGQTVAWHRFDGLQARTRKLASYEDEWLSWLHGQNEVVQLTLEVYGQEPSQRKSLLSARRVRIHSALGWRT